MFQVVYVSVYPANIDMAAYGSRNLYFDERCTGNMYSSVILPLFCVCGYEIAEGTNIG